MTSRTQTIAVFGATGFIGRHLIQHLARTGATIRLATRNPNKAAFLKPAGAVGQILPWAADVTDDTSVRRVLNGVDGVINLIGALYERGADSFQAVHVDVPSRLGRLAKEAGVERFVHLSAIGAAPGAKAAYARTKFQGEEALRKAMPEATILRPSIVFGSEDNFFNKFASMAQLAPALPLIGGGTTRFQPVEVGDVAEAITRALSNPEAVGKTYELGGPNVYTFKALMEIILQNIDRPNTYLVPVPWQVAEILGGVLEKVPFIAPILTRDQVEMLKSDNVLSGRMPGLADLGITEPAAVEVIVPAYLQRFIVGGTYAHARRKLTTAQ